MAENVLSTGWGHQTLCACEGGASERDTPPSRLLRLAPNAGMPRFSFPGCKSEHLELKHPWRAGLANLPSFIKANTTLSTVIITSTRRNGDTGHWLLSSASPSCISSFHPRQAQLPAVGNVATLILQGGRLEFKLKKR